MDPECRAMKLSIRIVPFYTHNNRKRESTIKYTHTHTPQQRDRAEAHEMGEMKRVERETKVKSWVKVVKPRKRIEQIF